MTGNVHPTSTDIAISPTNEMAVVLSGSDAGTDSLYLLYHTEGMDPEVVKRFLDWKNPPRANWRAELTVAVDQETVLFKQTLDLEPAIRSGNGLYFRLAQYQHNGRGPIQINLTPKEPLPFGSGTRFLSIRTHEASLETHLLRNAIRRFMKIPCILVTLALVIDYLRLIFWPRKLLKK